MVPTGTVGVKGVGPNDWGTCEAVGNGVVCDGDRCGSGSLSDDMLDEVSDELDELSAAIGSATGCSSLLTGGWLPDGIPGTLGVGRDG